MGLLQVHMSSKDFIEYPHLERLGTDGVEGLYLGQTLQTCVYARVKQIKPEIFGR
jgi:hypothetical protein